MAMHLRLFSSDSGSPPPIDPLPVDAVRPLFSVMLPTREPDERLCHALRSVLAQAIPPEAMQITVVDDASRPGLTRRLVAAVDTEGRVDLVECEERLGLAGNWNRAIRLARGRLVHLLHQDDYVLPGFYDRMQHGFASAANVGMAFSRTRIIDEGLRTKKLSSRPRWLPGVITDWLQRIAERQRIQTPAAVVARGTYESVGGYRPELRQALDWEMWVRIAARFPVWYEPRVLAVYRRHPGNESARLSRSGQLWPDIARAIGIIADTLPAHLRERVTVSSVRWHTASALRTVERLLAVGASDQAAETLAQIPELLRLLGERPLHGGHTVHRRLAELRARVLGSGRRAA
jgi:glycosyltransferase involved in cell wall biosynthesis